MALSKLDNLYRQVILDHSSRPHHYGELHGGETVDLNNPTCGDVIKLTMQVDDDRITDIAFNGSGCSISTASAVPQDAAGLYRSEGMVLPYRGSGCLGLLHRQCRGRRGGVL